MCRGDLSRFYDLSQMRAIGELIVKHARRDGNDKLAAFATDFLPSAATSGKLSEAEARELAIAVDSKPDYLIFNETSVSDHWESVANYALEATRAEDRL